MHDRNKLNDNDFEDNRVPAKAARELLYDVCPLGFVLAAGADFDAGLVSGYETMQKDAVMVTFSVKLFDYAVWDGQDPKLIEADSEEDAARLVCGNSLKSMGHVIHLRAQVWETNRQGDRKMFYTQ